MRALGLAVVLGLVTFGFSSSASAESEPGQVEKQIDLSHFSGNWLMEENGRWTRESWGSPSNGSIEGQSSSGTGAKPDLSEKMRIGRDETGTLTFWARPDGARSEIAFRHVPTPYGNWIFENLKNDYPQRIIYYRYEGWLFAQIMMADGSRTKRYVYRPATPPTASANQPLPKVDDVESAVSFARRCIDEDGYTNCLPPERTIVRNLICWPADGIASYIEPYRSSPAADCSFESHTKGFSLSLDQNGDPRWRADFARLHYLETNDCSSKGCKRDWIVPRD